MKQRIPRKLKKRWKKLGFRFTFDPNKFLDEIEVEGKLKDLEQKLINIGF